MSIEANLIYGFYFKADEETDEKLEELENTYYELSRGYSGDPIPGYDAYAVGIPIRCSTRGESEKDFLNNLENAKKKLKPEIIDAFQEQFGVSQPKIIMTANGSW